MEYGMFTDAGNHLVHALVMAAKSKDLDWDQVYEMMEGASKVAGFEEILDTEVRESVYMALQNT
jgi:hypothetical protein